MFVYILVGSGQALFLQPFTLDKVTFENAAAEEAMRPLLERLEVWLAKESSGECAAGTERGFGVLVNGNKVLYRSEVELPHLSPYAPSQKEMTGGTSNSNRRPADVPKKYWAQRFELFSRFNQGIRLDEESWYSVSVASWSIPLYLVTGSTGCVKLSKVEVMLQLGDSRTYCRTYR